MDVDIEMKAVAEDLEENIICTDRRENSIHTDTQENSMCAKLKRNKDSIYPEYLGELYRQECLFTLNENKVLYLQDKIETVVGLVVTKILQSKYYKSKVDHRVSKKLQRFVHPVQISRKVTDKNFLKVGSMYENTKNHYPDEFDFICILAECDIIDYHAMKKVASVLIDIFHSWIRRSSTREITECLPADGSLELNGYFEIHGPAAKLCFDLKDDDEEFHGRCVSVDISPAVRIQLACSLPEDIKVCYTDWKDIIIETGSVLMVKIYSVLHPKHDTEVKVTITESELLYIKYKMSEKHRRVYRLLKYMFNGSSLESERKIKQLVKKRGNQVNMRYFRIYMPKVWYNVSSYSIKVLMFHHMQKCENSATGGTLKSCVVDVLTNIVSMIREVEYMYEPVSWWKYCWSDSSFSVGVQTITGQAVELFDEHSSARVIGNVISKLAVCMQGFADTESSAVCIEGTADTECSAVCIEGTADTECSAVCIESTADTECSAVCIEGTVHEECSAVCIEGTVHEEGSAVYMDNTADTNLSAVCMKGTAEVEVVENYDIMDHIPIISKASEIVQETIVKTKRRGKQFFCLMLILIGIPLTFAAVLIALPLYNPPPRVLYCWNGIEYLENLMDREPSLSFESLPLVPLSDTESEGNVSAVGGQIFCIAFDTINSSSALDEVRNVSGVYACRTDNRCDGEKMFDDYKIVNKSQTLPLWCKNYAFETKNTLPKLLSTDQQHSMCLHKESCLNVSKLTYEDGHLRETVIYSCNRNTECRKSFLTDVSLTSCVLHQSERRRLSHVTIEVEVCCCDTASCYKPYPNHDKNWIIYGLFVALGILLVVFVFMCGMIVRCCRLSKNCCWFRPTGSSVVYNKTKNRKGHG